MNERPPNQTNAINARLLIVRALDLPVGTLLRKGLKRIAVEAKSYAAKNRTRFKSTRTSPARYEGLKPARLLSQTPDRETIEHDFKFLTALNDLSLKHDFNLLGSGWVNVRRGLKTEGVEGHFYTAKGLAAPLDSKETAWLRSQTPKINEAASVATWLMIEETSYQPIDWHLDFKSGYRWNPAQWWRAIPHGHLPGVDIKVPWELARMQHLAAFALEAIQIKTSDPKRAAILLRECRSQILDFIAQNSPLFGVNWRCAMDVGIRAANWILAVDLFRGAGFEFDSAFNETLLASLEDHGKFIVANFEKYPDFRGNHYLANICGLAFIAAAMPEGHALKKRWLAISRRELLKEAEYQFHADGSNFEASTSYHRLSGEMLVFTLAALRGEGEVSKNPFSLPSTLIHHLSKMAVFSEAVTKPSGDFTQIGDCDSGRFFKVPPRFTTAQPALEENDLDQRDLVIGARALLGLKTLPRSITAEIVRGLSRASEFEVSMTSIPSADPTSESLPANAGLASSDSLLELHDQFKNAKFQREYFFEVATPAQVKVQTFSDFGVVILRGDDFFLSFRCGPLGQYGRAGHDHDDQLSIELESEKQTFIADPGTYLYTPLKERRNQYRSIRAHFAPQFDAAGEVADLEAGLFYLRRVNPGKILHVSSNAVAGRCERGAGLVYRLVSIEAGGVRIQDWSDAAPLVDLLTLPKTVYSRGYGRA